MRFARWVFLLAGVSDGLMMVALYFMEERLGREYPPAVNHPEYYYGFVGVTLAWQLMFLVIALARIIHEGRNKSASGCV